MENKNLSGGTAEAVQNLNARKFRTLTADEIEVRVASVNEKGCTLLLYKDARVDCKILDETVGATNWQRSHEVINGNLFCNVGIYDAEKDQWIWKQDVGVESYTEKEKGQASDSFKRACFLWGIGRELYTAPFIWVKAEDAGIKNQNGKYKVPTTTRFWVNQIAYEGGKISVLEIMSRIKGEKNYKEISAFTMGKSKKPEPAKKAEPIDEPPKEKPASPIKKGVDEWMKENKLDRATMVKFICDYMPQERQKALKEEHKFNNFSELNNRTLASYYLQIEKPKEQPCLNT